MKTLPAYVYRDAKLGDCTNGGISERYDTLYLICDEGYSEKEDDSTELLRLVRRNFCGREYLHAEPTTPTPEGCVGPMFGGNFIYTCDSRFPSPYPIPVHDRYETYEEYELLSR